MLGLRGRRKHATQLEQLSNSFTNTIPNTNAAATHAASDPRPHSSTANSFTNTTPDTITNARPNSYPTDAISNANSNDISNAIPDAKSNAIPHTNTTPH